MEEFTVKEINMLSDEVSGKVKHFHFRTSYRDCNGLVTDKDHGPEALAEPIIPYLPMKRSSLFLGTRETGSYNIHSQLDKFKGKYFHAWANGYRDELESGQKLLVSSSSDGQIWSEPVVIDGGEEGASRALCCVGMRATEDELYVMCRSDDVFREPEKPGMHRIEAEKRHIAVYASKDGVNWKHVYTYNDNIQCIFEAPRPTRDGNLLCVACTRDQGASILLWNGSDLLSEPEVIPVSYPERSRFPYGEGSWYQTETGRIIAFWRDEGQSCRLWVNYSDDGGKTFTVLAKSDIPDSMSRIYAGKLPGGRYYLCGNAFGTLMNRMHLMLFLSDDGLTFNKVYMVINDPTAQRLMGLLKADGYQYPCCLPDGDKFLIGYSINKEDIACGLVNLKELKDDKSM
jgi:hypothetical protein